MAEIKGKFPNGLDDAMRRHKIGSTELARLIGNSKQNVTRWANQSRALPPDQADKIAPLLKTTASELLLIDSSAVKKAASAPIPKIGAVRIPLVSWVSAGKFSGHDTVRPADVKKYLVADLPSKGDWIALTVQGDSMDLVARDGAIIFVDRNDERLRDNGFYVFILEDGSTTFKRYRTGSPPKLQPYSRNPDHETQIATEGLRIVGRVKRAILDLY